MNECPKNTTSFSQNNQKMYLYGCQLVFFFSKNTEDIRMKLTYMVGYTCNKHIKLSVAISPWYFFLFEDKDFFIMGLKKITISFADNWSLMTFVKKKQKKKKCLWYVYT